MRRLFYAAPAAGSRSGKVADLRDSAMPAARVLEGESESESESSESESSESSESDGSESDLSD